MNASQLLTYLEERTGASLRGVVKYQGNENDMLYIRDDVREQRMRSQIDRILARLQPESSPAEERAFPFGDLYVTVRRFEEAIIMHFPVGPDRGVVVSLEPEAARDLNSFTTECLQRIHDE